MMTNGQQKRAALLTKPTTAIVYLRVSTGAQAASGAGIEAQLAKCTEHCTRLGVQIKSVHKDEAISGKDGLEKRPGLRAVIKDVQETPGSVVVVYSLSRLGRSQRLIWTLLDDRGDYALPLSSATEPFETTTPMGRAMLGMLGVWAQLESDLASERTIDALAAVAARGTKLGAPSMREKVPESVDEIHRLRATRMSVADIAVSLNARGFATARKGTRWHPKTVRAALMQVMCVVALLVTGCGSGDSTTQADCDKIVQEIKDHGGYTGVCTDKGPNAVRFAKACQALDECYAKLPR